jgi:hypothetical protein
MSTFPTDVFENLQVDFFKNLSVTFQQIEIGMHTIPLIKQLTLTRRHKGLTARLQTDKNILFHSAKGNSCI